MFKYQPLRIAYYTEIQKNQIISNLKKSDKVKDIQETDTHVTYEQMGWEDEH